MERGHPGGLPRGGEVSWEGGGEQRTSQAEALCGETEVEKSQPRDLARQHRDPGECWDVRLWGHSEGRNPSQVVCGGPGEPLTAPWVMEAPEHSGQPWMVASEHTSKHGNECADVHTGHMQMRAHA